MLTNAVNEGKYTSCFTEVHYQLRPVSCLTSSVLGAQRLRSGEEAFCDNGWTVSIVADITGAQYIIQTIST